VVNAARPPRPPFPDWRQIERARLLLAEAAVVLRDLAAVDLPVPGARYLDAWALELAAASRFLDAAEEVGLALRTCHASMTMLQRAAGLRFVQPPPICTCRAFVHVPALEHLPECPMNAPREIDAPHAKELKPGADPAEKNGEG
jgi:hypothetical protein